MMIGKMGVWVWVWVKNGGKKTKKEVGAFQTNNISYYMSFRLIQLIILTLNPVRSGTI